jgi:hypothetical protein
MPVDPTRKGFGPLYLTLAVMFACALVLLTDAKCHGQNKPEEASFRIDVPGPGGGMSSGSGTGISEHLVLTNNHVGKALDTRVVVWHAFSRKRWDGIVVSVYPQADLALVYVAEGGLPWVTINGDGLKAGEAVYACGYGSNAILRRGEGVVTQVTGRRGEQVSVWDTGLDIEPGDSGSGIFNQAGELVGVNWGEDVHVQRNAATSATHVVELCNHFQETQCGGGGCQMGGFPRSGGMGGGQMLPVRPPVASEAAPAVPARPPVVASPAAPAAPGIDAEKLAATLIEKLAGDERFKGPKGERGEPGPAGPPGKDGRDAEVDYDRIVAEVESRIDYPRLAGMVWVDAPRLPSATQHVVIVADQNASYWPRLAGELARAREAYHRIDLERPPAGRNFGELPALVWYENGVPVRQVRGSYEVTNELTTISRGEATPLN